MVTTPNRLSSEGQEDVGKKGFLADQRIKNRKEQEAVEAARDSVFRPVIPPGKEGGSQPEGVLPKGAAERIIEGTEQKQNSLPTKSSDKNPELSLEEQVHHRFENVEPEKGNEGGYAAELTNFLQSLQKPDSND